MQTSYMIISLNSPTCSYYSHTSKRSTLVSAREKEPNPHSANSRRISFIIPDCHGDGEYSGKYNTAITASELCPMTETQICGTSKARTLIIPRERGRRVGGTWQVYQVLVSDSWLPASPSPSLEMQLIPSDMLRTDWISFDYDRSTFP